MHLTADPWPPLELEDWSDTYATLHRWTQIVGKTRLALTPFENHWWNAALFVSAHGLTTSAMPCDNGLVEIEMNVLDDQIVVRSSEYEARTIPLLSQSVAEFYREYCATLDDLGIRPRFWPAPNELRDARPFAEDREHATYDANAARRWWRALTQANRLLSRFRGQFSGKCSPSHFWWGGFDLACTRFSGRDAPPHPGGIPHCPDYVMRESYSRECISAGWWPGSVGGPVDEPAFYAYAYPEPPGCADADVLPSTAYYNHELREWILPWDAVRTSDDPDAMVMSFLESTYAAAARLGGWDVEHFRARPPAGAPVAPVNTAPRSARR